MNRVNKFTSNLFRIHLMVTYNIYLGFTRYIFPLCFKIKISMHLFPTCMLQVLSISPVLIYITSVLGKKVHCIFLNALSLHHRY